MSKSPKIKKLHFWPLLGLVLGIDIVVTLVYTTIVPGLSTNGWGDVLCASAFFLAIGSALPVFMDAGRGFGLAGKMGGSKTEQHEAFEHERAMREKGMQITFVLALSTVLIGILSIIMSLL